MLGTKCLKYVIMISVINMILMKDIIQEGHPTLRKRAVEVSLPLNDEDFNTLKSMMEFVVNSQDDELAEKYDLRPGVGLAAPQIGVSKKMFCMHTVDENGERLYSLAVVNPKIISQSEELTYLPGGEGCLSVDEEKNGLVPRSSRIKAKATLVNLTTREEQNVVIKLSGYPGIVFQHEYDHLLGILFVDKKKEELRDVTTVQFAEFENLAE